MIVESVENVVSVLRPQEKMLATLELDLDSNLHFVKGLVVLTNQRILSLVMKINTKKFYCI